MAASYPTAAKAFTTKNTGDTVQNTHINDLQDEITALETALLGTIAHAISISGLLAVSGFGSQNFAAAGTGLQVISPRNTTAGTGNGAGLKAGNDAATNVLELYATSTTYTAAGVFPQDGALVNCTRAGGLSLAAEHASGAVRVYSGGALRSQWSSTGLLEHNNAFALTGITAPTQLLANTNNYAPSNFSICTWFRVSSDAARDITGLDGGTQGRLVFFSNQGSFTITLKHESGSSGAANRFQCPGAADFALTAAKSVPLFYDSSASRWYVVGG